MMGNHQSDGKNALKRIEFIFQGVSYKFILNPEEYHQSEPNRVTATQTKGGAWTDEFGAGIATIQFQGTTGFKNGTKDPLSGFTKFKSLRDTLRSVYNRVPAGYPIPSGKELYFYNYTDEEYWVVTPTVFELMRSVSRPLLYSYNVTLICNRMASEPNDASISDDFQVIDLNDFGIGDGNS